MIFGDLRCACVVASILVALASPGGAVIGLLLGFAALSLLGLISFSIAFD